MQARFVEDTVFGAALQCDEDPSDPTVVTLPSLPYGDGGDFTIALWFRLPDGAPG